MNSEPTRTPPVRSSAGPLLLCGVIGIVFGAMAALNIAGRMAPPVTEARALMHLLEVEYREADKALRTGTCPPVAPERMGMLRALAELVPISVADNLVVDAQFLQESRKLQAALRQLEVARNCPQMRSALREIDAACRDCHDQYRTGG